MNSLIPNGVKAGEPIRASQISALMQFAKRFTSQSNSFDGGGYYLVKSKSGESVSQTSTLGPLTPAFLLKECDGGTFIDDDTYQLNVTKAGIAIATVGDMFDTLVKLKEPPEDNPNAPIDEWVNKTYDVINTTLTPIKSPDGGGIVLGSVWKVTKHVGEPNEESREFFLLCKEDFRTAFGYTLGAAGALFHKKDSPQFMVDGEPCPVAAVPAEVLAIMAASEFV